MSATEIKAGRLGIHYLVDGSESASMGMNVGGPPNKAALVAVMTRHGLVPATPQ